jgi:cell division protein FtsQ
MFGLVIFLFSFTSNRNGNRKLAASKIVFVEENSPFLKQETVNKLLIENNRDASAIRKDKLDLNKLEKAVNSNPMVEKSDVFVTVDGVLKAVVKQKTPIVRVLMVSVLFILITREIQCRCRPILLPEFPSFWE